MARSSRLKALTDSVQDRAELPPAPWLIALSGGADSGVLAWLAQLRGGPVRALHVHHGWPGSDRMEDAARAVADHLALPIEVVSVEPRLGSSPEAAARDARYEALVAALAPGEVLLTGHTLDDQAETVLANLLRGTGLDGLTGMPRQRDRIHRPLLGIRREELRELAALIALPFRDDPANLDLALRRNFIRWRLLGDIEGSVAPGTALALARFARLVEDDVAYLAAETARRAGSGLACPVLNTLPVALARRAIRAGLAAAGADRGLRFQDVEEIRRIAREGGATRVPVGLTVRRVGQRLEIGNERQPGPGRASWDWLGTLDWGTWRFEGHMSDAAPSHFSLSPWAEVFDADEIPTPVQVRPGNESDTIRLRSGTKAVGAAFAEAGFHASVAASWPVMAAGDDVIWIPGVRRAFVGWVGEGTRRYLCVGAVQEGP